MDSLLKTEYLGAYDSLFRKLPEISGFRKDRFVGLFYWTWHTRQMNGKEPKNNTEIIAKYPEAVNDYNHFAWENTKLGYPYYWGEPIYGYYDDNDDYVIERNAELLSIAGVDVIIFDCTNGNLLWDDEYKHLADVYKKAMAKGISVPKLAFMLNFCPIESSRDMLKRLYNEFYKDPENKELFFYWEGKPLIMAHPECLDTGIPFEKEIFEFFTFRRNEPTYFAKDTKYEDKYWGWCSVYPQTKFGIKENGKIEQMCVSVAQNANDEGLNAMNSNGGIGIYGRSYSKGDYSYKYDKFGELFTVSKNTQNISQCGINFQQEWDEAIKNDPDFVFVTGWNEQIAGRYENWQGTVNAFPDQFDFELSRDIEPSKTIIGDCYYYQLCQNIRRYKGIPGKNAEISSFKYYKNTNIERAHKGTGNYYYEAKKADNAIIESIVEKSDKITIKAICEENIENASMWLLLTTEDAREDNSWDGFDFIINRIPAENGKVSIEKSTGGFSFTKVGEGYLSVTGNVATFEIPLKLKNFGFKWLSNTCENGDFLESYIKGQAVPNGRFYYKA